MKKRLGFVSNSSSSSFLVKRIDFGFKLSTDELLTEKEKKKLEKFGFKKMNVYTPEQVTTHFIIEDYLRSTKLKNKEIKYDKENYNYGYEVMCNQSDVIEFLLKNNIPFEASIHYNHQKWIYKRNAKYIMIFNNFGEKSYEYNEKYNNKFKDEKPVEKILASKYLKDVY